MRILVTAGNTQTPIDPVRCITNIFTGKTGTRIALEAYKHGHDVTLLTSHPEVVLQLEPQLKLDGSRWQCHPYVTYDNLHDAMRTQITGQEWQAIIHAAAVSDYQLQAILAPTQGSSDYRFNNANFQPVSSNRKISSTHPELLLHLVPTQKLIDLIRTRWNYQGILVKFKLELDIQWEELLAKGEDSRKQSQANLMVANRMEDYQTWAWIGPIQQEYLKVTRTELASRLLQEIERATTITSPPSTSPQHKHSPASR